MTISKRQSKSEGFTLVELAIVMIIIGLLIGGILKGQQMIENAKVSSLIAQVKAYQAALNTFKDTYAGTPGDIAKATDRIANCDAATFCVDGDGNNLVGGAADPIWTSIVTNRPETIQFWKHLVLANLITGVPADAATVAPFAWGDTHPAASIGGGFEFYFDPLTTSGVSGHFLRLSNQGVSGGPVGSPGASAVSPIAAHQIDRKIDDGQPLRGSVMTNYGVTTDECNATASMHQTSGRRTCVMFFLIDG